MNDNLSRVTLRIQGSDYTVLTDEAPDYVQSLAHKLDDKLRSILAADERVSLTSAAILAALDYLNDMQKSARGADNLRSQIKDYLEDSAKSRIEVEESRRTIERLRREIETLNGMLGSSPSSLIR